MSARNYSFPPWVFRGISALLAALAPLLNSVAHARTSVFGFAFDETKGIAAYLTEFLNKVMPIVITAAIVMVVYSGIEYIFSSTNPENTKKAKQRIYGIIGGLIFFILIRYLASQFKNDMTLTDSASFRPTYEIRTAFRPTTITSPD
jgi:uncharacterized membrane protein